MKHFRSILALVILIPATIFNLSILWGLFALIWFIQDQLRGSTYLLEEVGKKDSPVLFWTISGLWLFTALWWVLASFYPT